MRVACAILALTVTVDVSCAQQYTLTTVAGPADGFVVMGDGPSINNAGAIAFQAGLTSGAAAIVRISPLGAITTIASTVGGQFVSFDPRPSIDPLGDAVVFGAAKSNGNGVFAGSGAGVNIIVDASTFASIAGSPMCVPGSSGDAVFVGSPLARSPGIFHGNGGTPIPLAGNADGLSDFGNNTGVNATGAIAFRGTLAGTGAGVFRKSGATIAPLALVGPSFTGFAGTVALNAHGRAAFRANTPGGQQAIIAADENGFTIIADTSGPYLTFNVPAINDAGEVVFRATLDAGGSGIFRGSDPVADRIAVTGDALDGSTISTLAMHSSAINNHGQVVFQTVLSNGRQEIVRADPPPCPADVILDRTVNVNDLLAVISAWGACAVPCPPACSADIVADCAVNVNDLLAVVSQWGDCP